MIINFSVQNFGSIKDKQTLTFEADKSEHLEDYYVINAGGLRLLKMALIYGANASGKTTVLKALEFLRVLVLDPEPKKTRTLAFEPFLFDPNTPQQSSILSIEFVANTIRYYYEVEFNKKAIVSELLNCYHPKKSNVFKRSTDLHNQLTEIKFGNKVKLDRTSERNLEANTLWNNTVLGGFLKTNADVKELMDVVEWFKNHLHPMIYTKTNLEGFVTSKIDSGAVSKLAIVNIMQKADFHISDLVIKKEEEDIPDGLLDFLKKQLKETTDEIQKMEESGKVTALKIELEHTVNEIKYTLPLDTESQGTRRYFAFAGLLTMMINEADIFSIDELESSLHPDLYIHFLLSFIMNAQQSQLIATTHNREILDNKDIFRNDVIWFTDKNDNCATELYSLADFDSAVVRNTTNILNAYKSGKLNATPRLGDHYIDLKS